MYIAIDTLLMSVNMSYRMGQTFSSKLFLISAPNIDGFYQFYQCYAYRHYFTEDL